MHQLNPVESPVKAPSSWLAIVRFIGFKRLFWRIFIAFWLASLLVMFATGFVLVNDFSSDEIHQRYVNDLTSQAERMVWRYENEGFDAKKLAEKIGRWEPKHAVRSDRLMPMQIFDSKQKPVYRFRGKKEPPQGHPPGMIHLTILGPSNGEYQVIAPPPEPPRLFRQVFYRFQSLQFVFILIASALVSALLSWSIVRPLNSLGAFSRRYANQQQILPLPKGLLKRSDELGNLALDIDYMVKQTDKTVKAQRQLLHDVSHELRAPLARLQASAALIEQKMPDNRHALQINNDCVRIDQLIQQILNFSKIEQDQQAPQHCELSALCQQVIDNMAIEYPANPVSLTSSHSNISLSAYPHSLLQALDNIVGNACKYSAPGKAVEIQLSRQKNGVEIIVRDHGEGVNELEIERLSEPFYRAGNQMHTQGFGLGLSIAQRAIQKHQGTLSLQNHPQGGLQVSIFLPDNSHN